MSQMPPSPPGPPGPPGQTPPPGQPPGQPPQPPGPPGPPGGQWGQPAPKGTNPLIFVIIGVVAVVVVGIGAVVLLSGGDDQRDEYVDALTAGYTAGLESEEDPLFSDLTEDNMRCMAGVMVDAIGVDQLSEEYTPDELREEYETNPDFELDVTGDDPTREQAEQFVDGTDRCWSFFDKLRGQVQDTLSSNPNATPEVMSCVDQALDDEFLRGALVDDVLETRPSRDSTNEQVQNECGHLLQPGF